MVHFDEMTNLHAYAMNSLQSEFISLQWLVRRIGERFILKCDLLILIYANIRRIYLETMGQCVERL